MASKEIIKSEQQQEEITYERMKGETSNEFERFIAYRDMGPGRSFRKVAKKFNIDLSYINTLSAKYHWTDRVKLWTDELDRVRRETYIKEVENMAKRHARQSMNYQKVLQIPAKAVIEKMENGDSSYIDFVNKSVDELFDKTLKAAQTLPAIIDIERKARGEPNEIIKQESNNTNTTEIVITLPPPPEDLEKKTKELYG